MRKSCGSGMMHGKESKSYKKMEQSGVKPAMPKAKPDMSKMNRGMGAKKVKGK